MDTITILLVAAAILAAAALVYLAIATRQRMRVGGTPPGPPTDMGVTTHDEPETDVGHNLDHRHHGRSSEDVSKAARDADRTLGH